jgi:ferredoxin
MSTVRIDRKRCQGTGYCEQLSASLFRLDAEGIATVIKSVESGTELDIVREAEDICPTRAIRVELRSGGSARESG